MPALRKQVVPLDEVQIGVVQLMTPSDLSQ